MPPAGRIRSGFHRRWIILSHSFIPTGKRFNLSNCACNDSRGQGFKGGGRSSIGKRPVLPSGNAQKNPKARLLFTSEVAVANSRSIFQPYSSGPARKRFGTAFTNEPASASARGPASVLVRQRKCMRTQKVLPSLAQSDGGISRGGSGGCKGAAPRLLTAPPKSKVWFHVRTQPVDAHSASPRRDGV